MSQSENLLHTKYKRAKTKNKQTNKNIQKSSV